MANTEDLLKALKEEIQKNAYDDGFKAGYKKGYEEALVGAAKWYIDLVNNIKDGSKFFKGVIDGGIKPKRGRPVKNKNEVVELSLPLPPAGEEVAPVTRTEQEMMIEQQIELLSKKSPTPVNW